jgi:hypothetical protein
MKNIHRNNACYEANQTSEQNKPPVVLIRKTGKNTEHVMAPSSSVPRIIRLRSLGVNFLQLSVAWLLLRKRLIAQ